MASNLPPGCSSPDGGIDHAYESALEALCDAVSDAHKMKMLTMLVPLVDEIYRQGYEDGKSEERMVQISESA